MIQQELSYLSPWTSGYITPDRDSKYDQCVRAYCYIWRTSGNRQAAKLWGHMLKEMGL